MSEILRSFRRNAVHVRDALALTPAASEPLEVSDGYIRDNGRLERYKRLAIPVRRALSQTDRAGFDQAYTALRETWVGRSDGVKSAKASWDALQQELGSIVAFDGGKMARREILRAWLDAAAFRDPLNHDDTYAVLMARWGPAAESLGTQLTEEAARIVLLLDESAAEALEEPVILPPPVKTPAPPRDRPERWWRRWRTKSQ